MTLAASLVFRGGWSQKYSLDRLLVSEQHRLGTTPVAATHLLQAACAVVVEVALYRAQGDARQVGDLLVGQGVALQPQHFHLTLDVRMRVVIYSAR